VKNAVPCRGTEGSNPASSRGESCANLHAGGAGPDGGESDRPWSATGARGDLAHIYAEIWKDVAPVHLVDVAVFCDSDDTHTGTAVELAGKQEYLCSALIHRPNHSAVQPFRLIGTCAGFRP